MSSPARPTKYVFVTGGVVSALGKGIVAASLGRLLKARGLQVQLQKFDPYLNVDPGTMSPFQHGEVFVTEDGAETDLDIGHYERFVDENLSRNSSHSAGAVWETVLRKERKGEFLGATVQVIPHITNEIKTRIRRAAEATPTDVVISEIGGTVGDIESLPFLEALRQFRREVGPENVMYIHVTLVPFIEAAGELKTKPTQHSVNELRRIGIHPDIVVCRSHEELSPDIREKVALFADVEQRAVIDVREEGDLLPDVGRQLFVRAADDDVRVDTDAPQFVDGVLRRLRLQLARRFDERDERHVEVQHILGADLAAELADRLEERQRLDVADGAPDLADDDVRGCRDGGRADARLDLVRDVRDHLHGRTEELALPLLAQDGVPDRAGGVRRGARQVLVDEALVVADVEIGLGAVLGDEHLTVLERAHRARVDVQVRIELLRLHLEPACLEEPAERGGDDSLAECRDDPARDEDVPRLLGRAHLRRPSRSRCARPGVRSISAPSEDRSPRSVRPARTPTAAQRPLPVSRSTDLKPSSAPRPFAPASPSIAISRRS